MPESRSSGADSSAQQPLYDVFLSYNSGDKPQVEALAKRLMAEAGMNPFRDGWHLTSAEAFEDASRKALDQSKTCAVFLGPSGLGPWMIEVLFVALDERVRDESFRVFPVLLPGAKPKDEQTLPGFLREHTWVDFRAGLDDQDAFRQLVAAIRGHAREPDLASMNPPTDEAQRAAVGRPGSQPLTRISEFETADSIEFLMRRAIDTATGPTPPNTLSTSFMLFAISESTDTEGPWAAHFLLSALNKLSPEYKQVRDRYFRSKNVQALGDRSLRVQRKNATRAGVPVAMTANMFATFERASDIALRTTGRPVIHARHLLAALLTSGQTPRDSGVLRRLDELGIDPAALRLELYDWMRGYGDRDAVWVEILIGALPAARRLGGFNADRAGGKKKEVDLLGIDTEVQAFAALIAARTVSPPLSIGLFGEWGSGKTFFMSALRSAIDGLSSEARAANRMQRELPFYKHIVQIEFNAWHYVEGNLWASLVEHILDNLYENKDTSDTRKLQEGLIKKLAEERALAQATNNAVATAAAATKSAQEAVDAAQGELNRKTDEVARLNADSVRKDFVLNGAVKPIETALKELGIDLVGKSAVDLETALSQIHGAFGRGQRFLTPLLRGKDRRRRFAWLALSLLGAPAVAVIVNYVMRNLPRAEIYAYASGLATLISTVVPWLKRQADWLSDRLKEAEDAQRAFDREMAKATADYVAEVTRAEQKLRELTSAFEAAQQKHVEAKGREAAAAAELEAATTGRLLANFIADRASSSDYRKHLGVLALVRDDFEKLSGLIEEENWRLSPDKPNEEPRGDDLKRFKDLGEEEKDKAQRINRIVLYIDDLDRCPPNKVVEVLQAVHLLLAFPLFVVVVGVDARWVTKSLETRYRELLHVDTKAPIGDDRLLFGAATPNDYLEKIFQIPFWLRPMDPTASENMLRGLLKESLERPPEPTDAHMDQPANGPHNGDAGKPLPPPNPNQPGATPQMAPAGATPPPSPPHPSAGGNPAVPKAKPPVLDLTITDDEFKYMRKLTGVLGRSPRALKRFVNVYRLIKAGLEEHELQAFTRPRLPLSDYQVVLFLLAVDTGAPLAARLFFETIEAGSTGNDIVSCEWLVNEIDKKLTTQDGADKKLTTQDGADKKLTTRDGADKKLTTQDEADKKLTTQAWADWRRLRLWLMSQQEAVPKEASLELLAVWTKRVGRYSFEVGGL